MDKIAIRRELLAMRRNVSESVRLEHEIAINANLCQYINELAISVCMAYLPISGEVDLSPTLDWLVRKGKQIVLPRVKAKENSIMEAVAVGIPWREKVAKGSYGILEPRDNLIVKASAIELILVPGIA
ncbi:MAG: 5-formyltetrahydrofolate cyclo-ligase, partial [bacterium]|nr:5-formyltetrahydrofolate cyclo-ligase [bacterium]